MRNPEGKNASVKADLENWLILNNPYRLLDKNN
jgi:hypothetical protein